MSALQDFQRSNGDLEYKVDWRLLGPFFWRWFHEHQKDMILKRKFLFLSVTILVRDLRPLFIQLFGPEPAQTALVME
jgi:hypothetical protein